MAPINPSLAPGVAGLLLTGGASRRLGRDKAAVVIDGERLADRTAGLLLGVVAPVIEVGPGYTDLPCVREEPAGSGPLAALGAGAAALAGAAPGGVLVVATDLGRLTPGLLVLLARQQGNDCVVPLDRAGRPQPVCARYGPAALMLAQSLVSAGHRSLTALLARVPVSWLPADRWEAAAGRPDALVDIDTPEELARLSDQAVTLPRQPGTLPHRAGRVARCTAMVCAAV